jgi:hypothetical protein
LQTAIVFENEVCLKEGMKAPTLTTQETAMIELLRAHPALAAKVAEVLAVVAGGGEGEETLDAAEARLVAPVRALGLHALGGWAQRAEQAAGARLLAGDPRAKVRAQKKRPGTAPTAGSQ